MRAGFQFYMVYSGVFVCYSFVRVDKFFWKLIWKEGEKQLLIKGVVGLCEGFI